MAKPTFLTDPFLTEELTIRFDDKQARDHWNPLEQKAEEDGFFFKALSAPEYHWHFVQGMEALRMGLFVPGVSSLLNGIEASLRFTLHQLVDGKVLEGEPSAYKVLSNKLIKDAHDVGLSVGDLAFPGEAEFLEKILAPKSETKLKSVEIVRVRNDICHGNIYKYIDIFNDETFFVPDLLKELSLTLLGMSARWAKTLGEYRIERGLRHVSTGPIPPIPSTLRALV